MATKPKARPKAAEPFAARSAFKRPDDRIPYTPGDRVGGDLYGLEIPDVLRPDRGAARITRIVLRKSSPGLKRASFRVHLFSAAPICAVHDGEVLASGSELSVHGLEAYIGAALVPMRTTAQQGAHGAGRLDFEGFVVPIADLPPGRAGSVYALLEALDHYSPAPGEIFTVEIEGQRALSA